MIGSFCDLRLENVMKIFKIALIVLALANLPACQAVAMGLGCAVQKHNGC